MTGAYGATLYAEVSAINNAGIQGATSVSSAGTVLVNPAWIPVASLKGGGVLNWSSVSGKVYQVWSTTNLALPFATFSGMITAGDVTASYTNSPTNAARFYRVQLFP